jgi:hypothetical protein
MHTKQLTTSPLAGFREKRKLFMECLVFTLEDLGWKIRGFCIKKIPPEKCVCLISVTYCTLYETKRLALKTVPVCLK